ncbi:MAG: potassium transporter Kup [Acidimicrobiia bacterium]|nr:potassium transporter Kup [Acidimicrobiia bacterium]
MVVGSTSPRCITSSHQSTRTLPLALAALGVVYGDIGTSPLYAMREAFAEEHRIAVEPEAILGVLSLIFWSLVIVITVKYVVFVMRADSRGEGGILALTSLIVPSTPRSRGARVLLLLGLFGTALLYGDGAITPAISVLSAVEGLKIIAPSLEPIVLPGAVVILVGLFAVQRRGTGTVGKVFGPVMVVWFITLAVLGAIHLGDAPSVFEAVNPAHAVSFFAEHTGRAFAALGSVFLVVTGGEALYADMGHFGARPIRIGWFTIVFPSLLIHYFGQGALLLAHPEAIEAPFFLMAPGWALVPLVLLATAATVIASQALISGVYSITLQAIQLGYAPRARITHTSATEHGQVYIANVNWVLMLACIALVIGFRTSGNLAAAYGVAVTATMVITTILFAVYARHALGWSWAPLAALITLFGVIDLAFFGANILKIPAGGWFPLVGGLCVFVLLTTWKTGRSLVYDRTMRGRQEIRPLVESLRGSQFPRVEGTAVYMTPNSNEVPPAFLANLRANHVLHDHIVFLSVTTEPVPHVHASEREEVIDLGGGFHRVTLAYGFMDDPDVPSALKALVGVSVSFDPDHTTYFLAREAIKVTTLPGMASWRERLFVFLHRNAASAARYFGLPDRRTIEIGVSVEL